MDKHKHIIVAGKHEVKPAAHFRLASYKSSPLGLPGHTPRGRLLLSKLWDSVIRAARTSLMHTVFIVATLGGQSVLAKAKAPHEPVPGLAGCLDCELWLRLGLPLRMIRPSQPVSGSR